MLKVACVVAASLLAACGSGAEVRAANVKSEVEGGSKWVGTYFPNWAKYRASPYTFTPSQLSGAINEVNRVWYSFFYFCPDNSMIQPYWVTELGDCSGKRPFELTSVEPSDTTYIPQIVGMKSQNPDLKVILSVGGWNFPSNFFSGMVSSSTSRNTFIQSCLSVLRQYNLDGIDLDWEYPCSPAREDYVKITCTNFKTVQDAGGDCANDKANLLLLVKEMREAFGSNYLITVASQADMTKLDAGFNVVEMSKYIDMWNMMTYDYSVSDLSDLSLTAPNQPLYAPSDAVGISQLSTATTIDGYISRGVDPSKLSVGIAYYGHTWYAPGLSGEGWKMFGLKPTLQGSCCGPMASTYGAKYGQYSQLCGTYMYSEIQKAGFTTTFDNTTQSAIGYMSGSASDSYTATGVWVSYVDLTALEAISTYAKKKGLAGAFAFDISQDSHSGSSFTFDLQKKLYQLWNA